MTTYCLLIVLLAVGALNPQLGQPPTMSAEEILESPDQYNLKIVTLRGWFRNGFEEETLQGHGGKVEIYAPKLIWVTSVESM